LFTGKRRHRGFNQAELIAWSTLKAPGGERLVLTTGAGCECLGSAGAVAGRDVVLVDDVYRMGTTMTEWARVLRRAGTANVSVARTLKLASKFEGLDLPGGGWAKFQSFEFQRQKPNSWSRPEEQVETLKS